MSEVRATASFGLWLYDGIKIRDLEITDVDHHEIVRVEHSDVWVPPTFTARFDREGLPLVELNIEYCQHERFRCRAVRVLARLDDESVASGTLRRIQFANLVKEAIERAAYVARELANDEQVEAARTLLETYGTAEEPVRLEKISVGDRFSFPAALMLLLLERSDYEEAFGAPLRAAVGDADHSREGAITHLQVAEEYHRAAAKDHEVIRDIADAFRWNQQTAKNAIAAARRAGYLPSTNAGQAKTYPL